MSRVEYMHRSILSWLHSFEKATQIEEQKDNSNMKKR